MAASTTISGRKNRNPKSHTRNTSPTQVSNYVEGVVAERQSLDGAQRLDLGQGEVLGEPAGLGRSVDGLGGLQRRELRALKWRVDLAFQDLVQVGMNEGWIVSGDASLAAYTVVSALTGIGRWYHNCNECCQQRPDAKHLRRLRQPFIGSCDCLRNTAFSAAFQRVR